MSTRIDAFAKLKEPAVFATKPRAAKPVQQETIEEIAEQNNFPSRQAAKAPVAPRRKQRRYRTGRNQHLGIKATAETIERFYKLIDEKNVPMGELLRLAMDALERDGASRKDPKTLTAKSVASGLDVDKGS
jgi:hypothetical protein